jgi:hypothetical protein
VIAADFAQASDRLAQHLATARVVPMRKAELATESDRRLSKKGLVAPVLFLPIGYSSRFG